MGETPEGVRLFPRVGQEPMSKFVRAVSPRIGEVLGAGSVRLEGPGNVAE